MKSVRAAALSLISILLLTQPPARAQNAAAADATPRIIGEVFANGRQLAYVSTLR